MTPTLELSAYVRRYSRDYNKSYLLHQTDWDERVAGWIWRLLENLSAQTQSSPIWTTVWEGLRAGINLLHQLPDWEVFSERPLDEIEPELLARLFSQLEDQLLKEYNQDRAFRISMLTRGKIREFLAGVHPRGRFARVDALYTTRIPRPRAKGRGLISDQVSYAANGDPSLPVGALTHTNAADLRAKTKAKLEADFQHIANCCLSELDHYEISLARHDELRSRPVADSFESEIELLAREGRRSKLTLAEEHIHPLISLYLQVDAGLRSRPPFAKRDFKYGTKLAPTFCKVCEISEVTFTQVLRLDTHPPRNVLVACAVLLQMKTRWNISSVLDLPSSRQHLNDAPISIQSLKNKTGDQTPPVLLDEADQGALRALRLLERRLALLKTRGWVTKSESMLWISPRREKSTGETIQISNWAQALRAFQEKHGLPRFSAEQVRDQALTIDSLGKGGLIAAMEAAGHAHISTLTSYVQNIITERLSSATNLEFQRRWDASVRYELNPAAVPEGTLLIPIGDGSSCANPESPPDDAWLQLGTCDARSCHAGEGCTNRRLLIDANRIEEVVRMKRFYNSHWKRLLNQNPAMFLKTHLPSMLFGIALFATIKRGPYRHLVPING